MRTEFFTKLQYVRFALIYYSKYYSFVSKLERSVYIFCSAISCGSVAGWFVWGKVPFLWATLIAISQIITVSWPLLPYSRRRIGLEMMIPKLRTLANEMEHEWDVYNGDDDYDFVEAHFRYSSAIVQITNDYLGAEEIPILKSIDDAANKQQNEYIMRRFNIGNHESNRDTEYTERTVTKDHSTAAASSETETVLKSQVQDERNTLRGMRVQPISIPANPPKPSGNGG